MKKLLSIAAASLAVAAFADGIPAANYSPTIGVTQITTTNKNTIVAVPFSSLADGGDISVTNLVSVNGLNQGTQIYVFKDNGYKAWILGSTGWTAVPTADVTNGITVPSSGDDIVSSPGAIWVVLDAAPAANESKSFYIFGQYANVAESPVTVGASNLIANPLQTPATIGFTGTPAKGDMIIIPNDVNPESYSYGKKGWGANGAAATLPTINVGQGFWYVSKSTSEVTKVNWTASN